MAFFKKVEIEISFEGDVMVQKSTVKRPDGDVITIRRYEMKNDQLHLRTGSSCHPYSMCHSMCSRELD